MAKVRAAGLSVVSNSLLVVAKLAVGIWTGSVAIVSEAIHSANDLLAAVIALYAVKRAMIPPDEDHRYGHGKFEPVSAGVEGGLILLAAAVIVVAAVSKLLGGLGVERPGAGAAIMAVSALVNIAVSSHLFKVGRRTDSIALVADAWHLRTDVYTSAGTGIAMVLIAITDIHVLDPLIAIIVALVIVRAGWNLVGKSLAQMVDRSLPEEETAIASLIQEHGRHLVGFHKLRSRRSGSSRYFDVHLVVCRDLHISEAHELTDHIEQRVRRILPSAEITIHVEPCDRAREKCEGRTNCPFVSGEPLE